TSRMAAASRSRDQASAGSYPTPNKPFHLFKPLAVKGGDGDHGMSAELPANPLKTLLGAGKVHLVGEDHVAVSYLGELGHLVIHVAHRPQHAVGSRARGVHQVQDQVGV